jgi:regulatory protein
VAPYPVASTIHGMLAASRITGIVPSRRDPTRVSIRVDGRAVATLSGRHIADLGLHIGQAWDGDLAAVVADAAEFEKAMKRAMNRLGARALSRRQLGRKLADLGFAEAVRDRVLDRLQELHLLDDDALARSVVRDVLARKPAGRRFLQQKLFQRGVDRAVADRAIDEVLGEVDQAQAATELARRRLRSLQRFDAQTQKRRLYGLLARRGFGGDTIDAVMRALSL